MLKSLFIENFVLIDHLSIDFVSGFSVITGETGAGKSILLGALGLILGERADLKSIKSGAKKCTIEAVFDISQYHLEDFFERNDLEFQERDCIIRRELYVEGKSRAFLNDSPVSLSILKELKEYLIDIHSQHQNLLIGEHGFQLHVLDALAETDSLLKEYQGEFRILRQKSRELVQRQEAVKALKAQEDYLRFQLEQVTEMNLEEGEDESLAEELKKITHAEEIKGALFQLENLLDGEEYSFLGNLHEATHSLSQIEPYFHSIKEIRDRLKSVHIELQDVFSEVSQMQESVEFDLERMRFVSERLDGINSLLHKHQLKNLEELFALKSVWEKELSVIDSSDDELVRMKQEIDKITERVLTLGQQLYEKRSAAGEELASNVMTMLKSLGIPYPMFRVDFKQLEKPTDQGLDEVRFLFSANRNVEMREVEAIASGGEIARLMLCIKVLVARVSALPSIIFDEIDTGLSGETAAKMAEMMREMGKYMQVIAITHLPQIASKGKEHYFVFKTDCEYREETKIRQLSREERIEEVARMLSGNELTQTARKNAEELLSN